MLKLVRAGGLMAVCGVISSACSERNDGNLTSPPALFVPIVESNSGGNASAPELPPQAGAAGDAVGPGQLDQPWPSTGCGQAPPPDQVQSVPGSRTGYTEYWVDQTGASLAADDPSLAAPRQFFVRLPPDYDPSVPYRIVYVGQGCGAYHAGKSSTAPLFNENQGGSEQAIYVGLSVPDKANNPTCYDNNAGDASVEWEAFDLIHTFVEKTFCVDNNRIFVAGYSTGGWLANMWSCYFGGTDLKRKFAPQWAVRGGARMTGSLPSNQPLPCHGPAAGIWVHDAGDKQNQLSTNIAALNLSLETMGCTGDYEHGPKQPWLPAENIPGLEGGICQIYTGCPADIARHYPLVFCTTNCCGHMDQSVTIAAFTKFFELMDPTP